MASTGLSLCQLVQLVDKTSCIWNIKHRSTCSPVDKGEPVISKSYVVID